jgi:hypothetical protein
MEDKTVNPVGLDPRLAERWPALVDIFYVTQLTWLYVFSAIYPFMGIFYGVLLLAGSVTSKAKKVGRVCLILGIINTALCVVAFVALLVLGLVGALASAGD